VRLTQDLSSELPSSGSSLAATRPDGCPLIAVIIPTRDRPESLKRCLSALAGQTIAHELEVIVVDDGSVDRAAVADVVAEHAFARLERQGSSGPARARNTGAAAARSEVLCFTDDDCEPHAAWAETMARAVWAGADAVAGSNLAAANSTPLATALGLVVDAAISADVRFAPSNNLACRRELFVAMPFDERYPTAAGEDREWCARLATAGYVLRIEPDAKLTHHSEARPLAFFRQQIRYGRGAFQFRLGGDQRRPLERPSFYLRLIRRGFGHGITTGLLIVAAQAGTALGFLLEWVAVDRTTRRSSFVVQADGMPAQAEPQQPTLDDG
jgi:glycosyltransferase involved in cell wall biosynthesis